MNTREFLSLFKQVKVAGQGWTALCPAHEDKKRSLSVHEAEGKVLLKCFAGCETSSIVEAVGKSLSDLFAEPARNGNGNGSKTIVRVYEYKDENGNYLFEVCRYEPKDFRPRVKQADGSFKYSLEGVRRVLYRFPELLKADRVILVEGEKDVDCLRGLGFVATTSQGGANGWRPEYGDCLTGKDLIIIPDLDIPGQKYAETVARSVQGKVKSTQIVKLPQGKDVSDWVQELAKAEKPTDRIKEELKELIEQSQSWKPEENIEADPLTVVEEWFKDENNNIDTILPTLKKLTPLQYEQNRKKISEKADIRVTVLDEAILPKKSEEKKPAIAFPEVEPWDETVDGPQLFEETAEWIRKYIVLNDGDSYLIAFWVAATWLSDIFKIATILNISSPTKGSGKTSLIDLLYQIVCRPVKTSGSGITVPVLFRINESFHPTIFIDEAEKLQGVEGAQELIGMINEGYRKGGRVFRCNPETRQVEAYDPFGFRVLAAIGNLWDTIMDRSIIISMQRKATGDKTARFFMNEVEAEGQIFSRRFARWTSDNKNLIESLESETNRPDWLKDRACDNHGPLFQIAKAAGGDCLKKLLAIVRKRQSQTEDTTGTSETLIKDIKAIFEEEGNPQKIKTPDLLDKLHEIESSPWGDMRGGKLTAQGLSKRLKPFVVIPTQWSEGTSKPRGYLLKDFEEVFKRYTPSDSTEKPVTPVTPLPSDQIEHKKHKENQGVKECSNGVTAVTARTGSNGEGMPFDIEAEEMP